MAKNLAREGLKSAHLEKVFGSLFAITVGIASMFLVTLFHEFFGPLQQRHLLSEGALLLLTLLTSTSLFLQWRRARRRHDEHDIDRHAAELTNNMMEILETALAYKWSTISEDDLCTAEGQRNVEVIWALTRDFKPQLGCTKQAIQDNLRKGKKYRYMFPHAEVAQKQFDVLLEQCVARVGEFASDLIEARCLHGRNVPAVDLVIFQPGDRVYLFFDKAPSDRRVLPVPAKPLGHDIAASFDTLWIKLPPLKHAPHERSHVAHA